MKKLGICTLAVFSVSLFAQAFAQGGGPKIVVNNEAIDIPSYIQDDLTYVPLRAVSENLGANVDWDGETGTVTITTGSSGQLIPKIVERLSPSVVGIIGNVDGGAAASYQDKYADGVAIGTGVVVKAGGEILTNAHVVKDMSNIIVVLSNGEGYTGRIKCIDEKSDLAVVKIDKLGLTVAKLAEAGQIEVGETVVALGTPLSMSLRNSATSGIVSGVNRALFSDYNLIQTDTAINPGNSGGPLVNLRGEVVGINSSKFSGVGVEGMCFSIPIDTVRYVLNQFDTYGKVRRPNIGVTFEEDWVAAYGLPTQNGLTIKAMNETSAAKEAGLTVGDVVTAVNGKGVHSIIEWNEIMKSYLPGHTVTLTVWSNGEFRDMAIALSE